MNYGWRAQKGLLGLGQWQNRCRCRWTLRFFMLLATSLRIRPSPNSMQNMLSLAPLPVSHSSPRTDPWSLILYRYCIRHCGDFWPKKCVVQLSTRDAQTTDWSIHCTTPRRCHPGPPYFRLIFFINEDKSAMYYLYLGWHESFKLPKNDHAAHIRTGGITKSEAQIDSLVRRM